ncbi:MAG: substrate-binding domain-containing protein [Propionibacteriaceae bacterium]|jgi:phosphate transport system substrate-binding protein|nr:substrate-binding domain-containing protein [Propionibacteriaceae bacterium]
MKPGLLAPVWLASLVALTACTAAPPVNTPATTASTVSSAQGETAAVSTTPTASLAIPADQFPKLDGSTANLPLASLLLQRVGGVPKTQADNLEFATTQKAYRELASEHESWAANNDTDDDPSAAPEDFPSTLLLAYEPDDDTRQAIADAPMEFHPIGRDALVFIANQSNPVDSLTKQQLIDIYTGKTKNWKDVGGKDAAITAFQRPEDSGSGALMRKLVMGDNKFAKAPSELVTESMGGLVEGVASYANTGSAIGYSVYYYVSQMYDLPGIKVLQADGVAPSNDTIASDQYPYVNDFYAVILADEPADSPARQLVQYLESPAGKALIAEAGYVPLP